MPMHISTSSSRETYAPLVSLLCSILFYGLQSTSSASAFCSLSRRGDQKVLVTCILSHVITQLFFLPGACRCWAFFVGLSSPSPPSCLQQRCEQLYPAPGRSDLGSQGSPGISMELQRTSRSKPKALDPKPSVSWAGGEKP